MAESRKRPKRASAVAAEHAWALAGGTEPDLDFLPSESAESAVIWLHGLDDRPETWAHSLAGARKRHPRRRWVFLRAPERRITCYDGMTHPAWGDFADAGIVAVGSADHETRDRHHWYRASVAHVHRTVDTLVKAGVPADRIAIVGVSQGGALAAEAALTHEVPLAGWAMLSGWLLPGARAALGRSANGRGSRVLVCHSTGDDQVDYGCATLAVELLRAAGANVELESIPGMLHVESEGVAQRRALGFLQEVLDGAEPVPFSLSARASQGGGAARVAPLYKADLPEGAHLEVAWLLEVDGDAGLTASLEDGDAGDAMRRPDTGGAEARLDAGLEGGRALVNCGDSTEASEGEVQSAGEGEGAPQLVWWGCSLRWEGDRAMLVYAAQHGFAAEARHVAFNSPTMLTDVELGQQFEWRQVSLLASN